MYAQSSPLLDDKMLCSSKVKTGQMISILSDIIKCDISAAVVGMASRIIGSQHNLWCPLFPPAFFP